MFYMKRGSFLCNDLRCHSNCNNQLLFIAHFAVCLLWHYKPFYNFRFLFHFQLHIFLPFLDVLHIQTQHERSEPRAFDGWCEWVFVTRRTYVLISEWLTVGRYSVCFKMVWHMFIINVGWSRAWFISLLQSFAIWKWRFVEPFYDAKRREGGRGRERAGKQQNMMRRKVYSYWLKNEFDIMWRMGSMSLHIQSRKLYKKPLSRSLKHYVLSLLGYGSAPSELRCVSAPLQPVIQAMIEFL